MSEVFFISDTHFGHKGILTFSGTKEFRKFDSIEEHDAELVRHWNSVVGKNDTVFHLGDFCFAISFRCVIWDVSYCSRTIHKKVKFFIRI